MIATLATRAAEAGSDVDRRHRRSRRVPTRRRTRTSRCSTTGAACPTTCSTTKRASSSAPASPPSSTRSTRRSAATRATTCPGVPGVGEKTAAKLVTTYGDLEGIFEHLDELPPKQRQNLGEARDRVFLNRQMSLLVRDVPLDVEPGDLRQGAWDRERGAGAVRPARVPHADAAAARSGSARRRAAVEAEADDARRRGRRDARRRRGRSRASASSRRASEPYALEPRWDGAPVTSPLRGDRARARRRASRTSTPTCSRDPTVRDALVELVGRGWPAAGRASREGAHARPRVDVRALQHDTAVMAYLLDPGAGEVRRSTISRSATCRSRCARPTPSPARSTSTARSRSSRPVGAPRSCCGSPTRSRRRSRRASSPISTSASSFRSCACWRRWRRPASASTASSSTRCAPTSSKQCEVLVHRIYAHAGEEFNVNSTPQLRTILFEKLGLVPVKKTKTGPSTDADSLQKMADEHPIVEDLLRYREVEKLRSTYADALPPLIRCRRSHPRDVQADRHHHRPDLERGAEPPERPRAHRRRSRDPQRVHRRRRVRACSPPTTRRSSCRVLAHLAEDPGLIDAFERGADVHTATAAAVFHVPEDEGRRRAAPVRQGRELRPRVRDGGLRPRAAPRHSHRRSGQDPRRLLRRASRT